MANKRLEREIDEIVLSGDDGGLAWSEGSHHGSSDVVYVAQDPAPSLKHGAYRIHRGEGSTRLSYERWRDEHGGSVPIQHAGLGEFSSLSDARAAARRHHDDVLRSGRPSPAATAPQRDPTRDAYPNDLIPGDLVMRRDVKGRRKYRVSHTGRSGEFVQVYAREVRGGSGHIVTFDRGQLKMA